MNNDCYGFVYLLVRPDNESVVKIGVTSKSAGVRASNYTDGEWLVKNEYKMPIWLAKMTELTAHKMLRNCWLDPKLTGGTATEVFVCSVDEANNAIKNAYTENLHLTLKTLRVPDLMIQAILRINLPDRPVYSESEGIDLYEIAEDALLQSEAYKRDVQRLIKELEKEKYDAKKEIELLKNSASEAFKKSQKSVIDIKIIQQQSESQKKQLTDALVELAREERRNSELSMNLNKLDRLQKLFSENESQVKSLNKILYKKIYMKNLSSFQAALEEAMKLLNEVAVILKH